MGSRPSVTRSPLDRDARFVLYDYLPENVVTDVRSIPGTAVWQARPGISCGRTAAWVVEDTLTAAGVPYLFRLDADPAPVQETVDDAVTGTELRSGIWHDFALPYQREIAGFAIEEGGGHVNSPAGSGKTLIALVWSLTVGPIRELGRGPVLAVVRAAARHQWAAEVARFADLDPFVVEPAAAARRRDRWTEHVPLPPRLAAAVRARLFGEDNRLRRRIRFRSAHLTARLPWPVKETRTEDGAIRRRRILRPPYLRHLRRGYRASLDAYRTWCAEHDRRPFIVVGWEALPAYRDRLAAFGFQAVIWDESHHGKSAHRQDWRIYVDEDGVEQFDRIPLQNRAAAAYALAERIPFRLCTTATPVMDRLADLLGQLTLVEVKAWGQSIAKFKIRYCNGRPGDFGGVVTDPPHVSRADELEGRRSFLRWTIPYSVLAAQLPPFRRVVQRIPADRLVARIAADRTEAADRRRLEKKRGSLTYSEKERLTEYRLLDACSAKRPVVLDLVDSCLSMGLGKVIVFSGRKRDVEALGAGVVGRHRTLAAWVAHGDTDSRHRDEIRRMFLAHPGPCVLIGSYQAWGESYNIQAADAAIVALMPYRPGEADQLEGRTRRLGQSRSLSIYWPIAEGTIEERLAAILVDKLPAVERHAGEATGLGGLLDQLRGTTPEELGRLFDSLLADLGGSEIEDEGE